MRAAVTWLRDGRPDRSACELTCAACVRGAGYCGRGMRSSRRVASMLQLVSRSPHDAPAAEAPKVVSAAGAARPAGAQGAASPATPPDPPRGAANRSGRCGSRRGRALCCGHTSSMAHRAVAGALPTTRACVVAGAARSPCAARARASEAAGGGGTCRMMRLESKKNTHLPIPHRKTRGRAGSQRADGLGRATSSKVFSLKKVPRICDMDASQNGAQEQG
jgi:hypothetical protein